MKDYLTIHKNMLGATTSGSRFNSSRSGSSKITSHASTPSGSSILKPGEFVRRSTRDGRTAYYRDGKKYTYEEYQAEMKRQEEERKRKEEAAANGLNHNQHDRGGNSGNGIAPGGNYGFNLEDDNTLLYAILAGIGIVGVAFLAKKNKNKNKKKKK